MEWKKDSFVASDDKSRLDIDFVFGALRQTYWSSTRCRPLIEEAIANSLCMGVYLGARQVAFARAVSDYATYTWLCDVIVDPEIRSQGVGKWIVGLMINHPKLQTCSQNLATKDAHTLYERFGFNRIEMMRRFVHDGSELRPPPK